MIAFDTHVHTAFSTDSDTAVRNQIMTAEKSNLQGICFTDHMDYDFPEEEWGHPVTSPLFSFDPDAYMQSIEREQQQTGLSLWKGVECGLQNTEDVIRKNRALVSRYEWDYVIGSVHLINRKDPYYPSFWQDRNPEELIRSYFETILENLKQFSDFDALGHLDYIVRYAPESFVYNPKNYMEVIDEILKILIQNGIALEVNTSGWKTEHRCQNPHEDILIHYAACGGERITIGSDAHAPAFISYRFADVPAVLKRAGLHRYCIYQKRKPVCYEL